MEESTVKKRLLEFLRHKRITQSALSKMLNVSPAYVGAMRKSLPEDKVLKLSELFPDLNRDWLLYGEGNMLKTDEVKPDLTSYIVPLLPVEAFAGNLQMYSRGVMLDECRKIVSPVENAEFAIRITGNSMEPEFHSGSILFIKRINDRSFIPWGNPMVVDTENGVLIKMLYPTQDHSTVEAHSYNPKYPPFCIPTDSIYGIYRIVGDYNERNTI